MNSNKTAISFTSSIQRNSVHYNSSSRTILQIKQLLEFALNLTFESVYFRGMLSTIKMHMNY